MLSPEERHIQALRFKVRAYQSDGQAFEDIFTAVMQKRYPSFRQIKPQGQFGDRKNDGFESQSGTYYQVFAPEDSWKGDKYGADKVSDDLVGLLAHWNANDDVKAFRYVVNDKYKGIGPEIEQALQTLRSRFPNLNPLNSMLTGQLEDEFLRLDQFEQDQILGGLPPHMSPDTVDTDALSNVIHHILSDRGPLPILTIPVDPSFERKIAFNNLPEPVASHFRSRNAESGTVVKAYFQYRSASDKDELAKRFKAFYLHAAQIFDGCLDSPSLIFFQILDRVTIQKTASHQNAALVLMAYFFESCDIYLEPPPKT